MSRVECIHTYPLMLTGTSTHSYMSIHAQVIDLRGDIGYYFMEADFEPCAAMKHNTDSAIILVIFYVPK